MPAIRYFLVTEIRTIKVSASTISDALHVARAGLDGEKVPDVVQGSITRDPEITEMHIERE